MTNNLIYRGYDIVSVTGGWQWRDEKGIGHFHVTEDAVYAAIDKHKRELLNAKAGIKE